MAVGKRLSKIAKECNVGISTIVDFLHKKGFQIESNPNTKISEDMVDLLRQEYRSDFTVKQESEKLVERKQKGKKSSVSIDDLKEEQDVDEDADIEDEVPPVVKPEKKKEEKPTAEFSTPKQKMDVKVVGKIDLDQKKKAEEQQKEEQKKVEETGAVESKETAQAADKPEKSSQEEKKTEDKEPEIGHSKKDESEKETPDQKVDIPVEVEKPDKDLKVVGKIDLEKKPENTDQKEVKAKDVSEKKEKGASKENKKEVKPEKEQAAPVEKKSAEQKPAEQKPAEEKPAEEKPTEEKVAPETAPAAEKEDNGKKDADSFMPTKVKKLSGPTVVGKIDLPANARNNESRDEQRKKKKKRKRIRKEKERVNIADKQQPQNANGAGKVAPQDKKEKRKKTKAKKRPARPEVSEEDVQKQIKETLARLTSKGKSKTSRHRRDKRDAAAQKEQDEMDRMTEESKVLKVTEFLTANDLSSMMDVQVTQIISTCMSLGLFVSINQRLDAETITLVAEEYGYTVEFISVDAAEAIEEKEDNPEDLKPRPPIITVMGHVDHGKTSLLDHIRKENVIAGEAGGITQHIGAYNVELADGREITFLDTPGHEAFTAMRARGAQVTDIAIIIVAADDNVMPQTIEAINHASAAGVPIVFAINKIDKPNANPDRVKEELAKMNYLVEEWGGKYQSQDISAKNGINIDQLLEKVLLEADLLELKANPDKPAVGSVIESTWTVVADMWPHCWFSQELSKQVTSCFRGSISVT
nr:translation initiation factor IF-2 N-terminal domain-containing protein [Marinilabilia salmonicolor]